MAPLQIMVKYFISIAGVIKLFRIKSAKDKRKNKRRHLK
jgi:hypothetical protein